MPGKFREDILYHNILAEKLRGIKGNRLPIARHKHKRKKVVMANAHCGNDPFPYLGALDIGPFPGGRDMVFYKIRIFPVPWLGMLVGMSGWELMEREGGGER